MERWVAAIWILDPMRERIRDVVGAYADGRLVRVDQINYEAAAERGAEAWYACDHDGEVWDHVVRAAIDAALGGHE